MIVITKAEYKRYAKAYRESYTATDPLSYEEVKEILSRLIGETVRSEDGCYYYTVKENGIEYRGEKLGKSIFDGLLGWVYGESKLENLVDLIEEIDGQPNTRNGLLTALWVSGIRESDIDDEEEDDDWDENDDDDDEEIGKPTGRLTRVGGYVYYDTPKKDEWGCPIRSCDEVETEVDLCGYDGDDCGCGTEIIYKALEAKVAKRFKINRNVECRECWVV